MTPDPESTGQILKRWRRARGLSQMSLALGAGISTRHLSFIETGKSRPSRDVLLWLSETLGVPLRERNGLLEAAGHARYFPESPMSGTALAAVGRALDMILEQQEPFGAVVLDRHWNVIRVNRGQLRLLRRLLPYDRLQGPLNHMDLIFDPKGLRPFITNWNDVARGLMARLQREVLSVYGDEQTQELQRRLLAYPGVPLSWAHQPLGTPIAPFLEIHIRAEGAHIGLFTTITTIGTPLDVTVQEVRVESFFPADPHTEAFIRALDTGAG